MKKQIKKYVVLAGNPLIDRKKGQIRLEPELIAFEQAMKFVANHRENVSNIYVAFDNSRPFASFLKSDLSEELKKSPNLSCMIKEVSNQFKLMAEKYSVKLDEIKIITEKQALAQVLELAKKNNAFKELAAPEDENGEIKANCKGIAASYLSYFAHSGDKVQAFVEYGPRCEEGVFTTAGELAHDYFGTTSVEVKMFFTDQSVGWKSIYKVQE